MRRCLRVATPCVDDPVTSEMRLEFAWVHSAVGPNDFEDFLFHCRKSADHARMQQPTDRSALAAIAVQAVDEVGNPTILATLTVVAAILPMAFVGGLMGPYMRPIPMGASAAMLFSLAAAFIVQPTQTRMPTFTPPPPLEIPEYTDTAETRSSGATGIFIVILFVIGTLGLTASFVLRK